jgi:ubiquinone biosynthesis protein COQ4
MADPNDTRQVFIIIGALRGRASERIFRRFVATPVGARVLAERRQLLPRLQDEAALEKLAQDTLGGAYLAFMRQEQLDAEGLVMPSALAEAEDLPPEMRLVRDRVRDAHDLNHTVTGYGREPLGELCLLAFMYGQTRNPGLLFIVLAGMRKRGLGPRARAAWGALWEAWRRGSKAGWLPAQDWEALLDRPLAAVRADLGLSPASRYQVLAASPPCS